MKSSCRPYLINESGDATALSRVPLKGSNVSEGFLQALLDDNPKILPVSRFDPGFAPLISLGREIMNIDNLFISPSGRLTVVEAKLWRNPQATRQVLAQMLHYASQLARLSYEELEQRCQGANQSALSSDSRLYQLVKDAYPEQVLNEAEFVDNVHRGLRNGRFLLLVVGDGIREGLEQVLDALHQQSRLQFTFGLVELQLYRHPSGGGTVAVPHILARSTEIERAVVTIRGAESNQVNVEVRSGSTETAPKLTEQEFLESVAEAPERMIFENIFGWARQEELKIRIAKRSAALVLPFSALPNGLILIRLFTSGRIRLTPPAFSQQAVKISDMKNEPRRVAQGLTNIISGIALSSGEGQLLPDMPVRDLDKRISDILEVFSKAISRLRAMDPEPGSLEINSAGDHEADDD